MWKCCQRGNVANVRMLPVSNTNVANSSKGIGNWKLGLATLAIVATFFLAPCAKAGNAYTNHAGNVVSDDHPSRTKGAPAMNLPARNDFRDKRL